MTDIEVTFYIKHYGCEDSLNDKSYAQRVYNEACELTAYLCKMYHLDPHGEVNFKGAYVPVILDHKTSYLLGLGNNHGDVQHWFPKILGKTQADIRNDVAALMNGWGSVPAPAVTLSKGSKGDDVQALQEKLLLLGYDLGKWGADGDFGSATQAAVMEFQANHNIASTGIVDTVTAEAIDAAVREQKPEGTYTVILRGLSIQVANGLKACYPECEVIPE